MGLYQKRQEPVEALQYRGTKASALALAEVFGSAVSWDHGRCYVSTHEGQRTPGKNDYLVRTPRGPVVVDRPDFEAGYFEIFEPEVPAERAPQGRDDLRLTASTYVSECAADGRTPLVQISMSDALLIDAKLADYLGGHEGPCEASDARNAVRAAISERLMPPPADATTEATALSLGDATDDGVKVVIVGEP